MHVYRHALVILLLTLFVCSAYYICHFVNVVPFPILSHHDIIITHAVHTWSCTFTYTCTCTRTVQEGLQPRHRFMSAFEQRVERPDRRYQFLLFAADPYETVAFKIPSWDIVREAGPMGIDSNAGGMGKNIRQ